MCVCAIALDPNANALILQLGNSHRSGDDFKRRFIAKQAKLTSCKCVCVCVECEVCFLAALPRTGNSTPRATSAKLQLVHPHLAATVTVAAVNVAASVVRHETCSRKREFIAPKVNCLPPPLPGEVPQRERE